MRKLKCHGHCTQPDLQKRNMTWTLLQTINTKVIDRASLIKFLLEKCTAAGIKEFLRRSVEHWGTTIRSLKELLSSLRKLSFKDRTVCILVLMLLSIAMSTESRLRPTTEPAFLISLSILFLSYPNTEQHRTTHWRQYPNKTH